jgi:predicted MFS family arabinose efflux permease
MLIFALVTTMLTEFLPKKASAGVAVNNFVRNIFSFAGAVAAEPIMNAIGNGWLFTILGLVSLVSGIGCIMSMKKWGAQWRDQMDKRLNNP